MKFDLTFENFQQIPASNVRFEQNKCLLNLDKMSFTDGDLVVLAPLLAAFLSANIPAHLPKQTAGKFSQNLGIML